MRLGKNMTHALDFATKYKGWHTFTGDRATKTAIFNLEKYGLVDIRVFSAPRKTAYGQFRVKPRKNRS